MHIMLNFMCVSESLWFVSIDTEEMPLFVWVRMCAAPSLVLTSVLMSNPVEISF